MSEVKDPLDELDKHLQTPEEGAKKAGIELEETDATKDKEEESEEGDNENKDEETEEELEDKKDDDDDDDELTLQDKHDYLKSEVGRMGNQIGDLTRKLKDQETVQPKADPTPDPLDAEIAAATKLYGPELVELIQKVAGREVAPVKQTQGLQSLRDRYDDFDDVRADMDKIFADSPALANAAKDDISVVDTVYQAAISKRGEKGASEKAQKDEARRKWVKKQKEDAHMEKPSGKANAPKKQSQKEHDKGFVGSLISSLSNDPG